jgi:hypothetical protein
MNKKSLFAFILSLLILSSCGPDPEELLWTTPTRLGGVSIIDIPIFEPIIRWEVRNVENCLTIREGLDEDCSVPPDGECHIFRETQERWCEVVITRREIIRTVSLQRPYNDQSPIDLEMQENELRGNDSFSAGCVAFELDVTISAEPSEPIPFNIQLDDQAMFERAMTERVRVGLDHEFNPVMYAFVDATGIIDSETASRIADCGNQFNGT